jgi:hypothetical protein
MTMTLISQAKSLILRSALRWKYTDVILLSLHNAVFNKYNSVDKSRSRINRLFLDADGLHSSVVPVHVTHRGETKLHKGFWYEYVKKINQWKDLSVDGRMTWSWTEWQDMA